MQIRNIIFLLPLAACGGATSNTVDALHCAMAFEHYATIAEMGGDERLSKGLHARQLWYIDQIKKLPASDRSQERINELAKESEARGEKELDISKSCMEQQDKDPAYMKWKAR